MNEDLETAKRNAIEVLNHRMERLTQVVEDKEQEVQDRKEEIYCITKVLDIIRFIQY